MCTYEKMDLPIVDGSSSAMYLEYGTFVQPGEDGNGGCVLGCLSRQCPGTFSD